MEGCVLWCGEIARYITVDTFLRLNLLLATTLVNHKDNGHCYGVKSLQEE